MPPMKEKIKNLFRFIGRAWSGGLWGKLGVFATIITLILFTRLFTGDVSIQRFSMDIWRLRHAQEQLASERATLDTLNHRIDLLQNYSPDYINELGLRYLNVGPKGVKILKI